MNAKYDFTGGQRGRFYQPGARTQLPVYLDEEVLLRLQARAAAEGVSLSDLVNELLRRDIGLTTTDG
jgi:hypothetical protein